MAFILGRFFLTVPYPALNLLYFMITNCLPELSSILFCGVSSMCALPSLVQGRVEERSGQLPEVQDGVSYIGIQFVYGI